MSFKRITEEDMRGRGNLGRPDTPGVSAAEMQRSLDELPREVLAPAFNELARQLEEDTGAAQLGAVPPDGLPAGTARTVQGALDALLTWAKGHADRRDNPHQLTARQVGAYTAAETEQAISRRVQDIGSADMNRSEYGGSAPGVVREADNARALGGRSAKDYADAVNVFEAVFLLDGWTRQPDGLRWTQTVPCAGMQAGFDTSAPWIIKQGWNEEDDAAVQGALDVLNDGRLDTLDGQIIATLTTAPPDCDVQIWMRRAVHEKL